LMQFVSLFEINLLVSLIFSHYSASFIDGVYVDVS
jgi:hypothetical protein